MYTSPVYPPAAEAAGVHGDVLVDALIGVDGRVKSARSVSGHPLLREAAEEAVRQWEYNPYAGGTTPGEVKATLTVNFP